MRHVDVPDLVAVAAEVCDEEPEKLADRFDNADVTAALAEAAALALPHEAQGCSSFELVRLSPLAGGNRSFALLAGVHLLGVNGLVADLRPRAEVAAMVADVAAGSVDTATFAAWLDSRVTARDPLDGALRDSLSVDALRALDLTRAAAHDDGRRLATPEDLLAGLLVEGTGPAALVLSGGDR